MTATIPVATCAPQGEMPDDGVYGRLRISLQSDTIGSFRNPAVIPNHVISDPFGPRDHVFGKGDPATFVSFQFEPAGSRQIAIIDTCFDDTGFVPPPVVMFLPTCIENGRLRPVPRPTRTSCATLSPGRIMAHLTAFTPQVSEPSKSRTETKAPHGPDPASGANRDWRRTRS